MAPARSEKLWGYADLTRLWSWSLIVVALALLPVASAIQAGSADGLSQRWFVVTIGVSALTAALLFPLLGLWLGRGALPSGRLPDAARAEGRRLEASRRDWRLWGLIIGLALFVGGAITMVFLVGVLGAGGTAEGVVVGVLASWGAVTLADVRRIRLAESAQRRRYYAACARPTGVANRLIWVRAGDR